MKVLQVLDRMTRIGVIAFRLDPQCEEERAELAHAGFGPRPEDQGRFVYLVSMTRDQAFWDPIEWGDRTMRAAHRYIIDHYNRLEPGDVVDVEFVLGETTAPKEREL